MGVELDILVREGYWDEAAFEQKPEWSEGMSTEKVYLFVERKKHSKYLIRKGHLCQKNLRHQHEINQGKNYGIAHRKTGPVFKKPAFQMIF